VEGDVVSGNRRRAEFGIGIGTLVLTANVVLSPVAPSAAILRHLAGSALDVLAGRPLRKKTATASTVSTAGT
jgi:hypothetical protein